MSEFKGTPGPWSVGAEDADNGEIEVISEARPYVCMVLPGAIDGTTAANARLIAAAPDSHEANVKMVDALNVAFHIESDWDDERIYDELPTSYVAIAYFAARDAIRKATGAQP